MINKPTLQEVTTCLNVINWAIDDLGITARDVLVRLYQVLAEKEREFKAMDSNLAAVIQAQEQDTKKPEFKEDNRVHFSE